ncbi:polysaccharide deacetylase family protein [Pseudorhodoferax sp.]|uniref:polysaccharide deacetylase family protein n=1 Tax=Pseudorhodoferax sp. TaxID=1993553 RepID=UPI002DD6192A|nr:polysaccharide deacetylase family protein [Pseudorhodoferax sp.]
MKALAVAAVALLLAGCASRAPSPAAADAAAPPPGPAAPATDPAAADPGARPQAGGGVLGRNERLLVYSPVAGDTLAGIGARFMSDAHAAWLLADANHGITQPEPGVPLVVPLRPLNPAGLLADGLQTVPILCYHRLGAGSSKMVVAPAQFEAQMNWLVDNGYRVIALADLAAFLAGRRQLPQRAVVITFDDGYASVYRHAYPVLKRLGLPATVFVYTDFIGGGDALTWPQLREMQLSGLIDLQSHSKSHRNLTERLPAENDERYRSQLDQEMRAPRELLERRLPALQVRHLAYPFGDANDTVLDAASRHGYTLGATVVPGGNPFYAHPLMLRRTMIFGDTTLDAFRTRLQVSRPLAAP